MGKVVDLSRKRIQVRVHMDSLTAIQIVSSGDDILPRHLCTHSRIFFIGNDNRDVFVHLSVPQ